MPTSRRHPLAPLLLALLVLAGCATLQPGYEAPTVTVTSFRPVSTDGGVPRFEIGLRVINPNRSPLELQGLAYNVSLEGRRLLVGVANDLPVIAGYGEGEVRVLASVDLLGGLGLITDLMGAQERRPLRYRLEAKLDVGTLQPAIRVEHEGTLELNPTTSGARSG